jgi:tetratricopeptide (TPR) repeat protein
MHVRRIAIAIVLALSTATTALAQAPGARRDPPQRATRPPPEDRATRLERLYERLAAAKSPAEARRFAASIDALRMRSGSDTADLLTSRAAEAMRRKENDAALKLLDAVVTIDPAFAEAWHRRATIRFLEGDYYHAMLDIRETLQREPRQWGAWAALGRILEQSGDKKAALGAYRRALAVYPQLESVKERADKLAVEVRGRVL